MVDAMENYGENWGFEETELRLGLPGGGGGDQKICAASYGKRGFSETMDLKLNLVAKEMKSDLDEEKKNLSFAADATKPPAKAQVVGWPPVRAFRKNVMAVQKRSEPAKEAEKGSSASAFVKVSMDGAPYLRKVDLKMYKSYPELYDALGKMFSSFTMGKGDSQGMVDFLNESKPMDLLNGSDCVPTYEDKDGDWMLVGDVPWEMFVGSCKRLLIMKGAEAKGLVVHLELNEAVTGCTSSSSCNGEMQEQKLNAWNNISNTACSFDLTGAYNYTATDKDGPSRLRIVSV